MLTVTATDGAGGTTTVSRAYTVVAALAGPVDFSPAVNVGTAGAAVPVSFDLGANYGMDIFAAGYPVSTPVSCENLSGTPDVLGDLAESTPAGLRYDAASGDYTYVWKTDKRWAGTCRQFTMKLAAAVPGYGGAELVALFRFR